MSIIKAVSLTTGVAKDVACDEQGRLAISGITLDGAVSIDLTSTNTLLDEISDILNPPDGQPFQVQIPATYPITLNTTDGPIDVNIESIDLANFVNGIPVRIESTNDTVEVKVSVESISSTTFPDGIPINVTGISTVDFPDGIPIKVESFNTVDFPDGIPINVTGISSVDFPNGIPIRIESSSEPLQVTIDTTAGPSVVTIDATQFTDLLNSLTVDGTVQLVDENGNPITASNPLEVTIPLTQTITIGDADGPFSNTNRLSTSTQLVDENGVPISSSNPLDVALTTEVVIEDSQLENAFTYNDESTGIVTRNVRPVINFASYDNRNETLGPTQTWRSHVISMPRYNSMGNGVSGGGADNSYGYRWTPDDYLNLTTLHTLSGALVLPERGRPPVGSDRFLDSEVYFNNETGTSEPGVMPLTQSDRGDLFVGYHYHTFYNSRSSPVDLLTVTPTRPAGGDAIVGRLATPAIRVGNLDGHVVLTTRRHNVLTGTTPLIAYALEWNPLRNSSDADFGSNWVSGVPGGTNVLINSPTSHNIYGTVNNSYAMTFIRSPILGRYCRVVCWLGSSDITGATVSFNLDVKKGPY